MACKGYFSFLFQLAYLRLSRVLGPLLPVILASHLHIGKGRNPTFSYPYNQSYYWGVPFGTGTWWLPCLLLQYRGEPPKALIFPWKRGSSHTSKKMPSWETDSAHYSTQLPWTDQLDFIQRVARRYTASNQWDLDERLVIRRKRGTNKRHGKCYDCDIVLPFQRMPVGVTTP